jgi:hypothetical protein
MGMKQKKNISDLLKEQAEFENEAFDSKDQKIYEMIFEELSVKPELDIDVFFAQEVVEVIEKQEEVKAKIWMYATHSMFFVLMCGVIFGTIFYLKKSSNVFLLESLSANFVYLLLGTFVYFVIQTLDTLLVKNKNSFV